MSDGEKGRGERTDSGSAAEEDEQLEDLEPGKGEGAAVKGGGPKEQQSMPGGDPTD